MIYSKCPRSLETKLPNPDFPNRRDLEGLEASPNDTGSPLAWSRGRSARRLIGYNNRFRVDLPFRFHQEKSCQLECHFRFGHGLPNVWLPCPGDWKAIGSQVHTLDQLYVFLIFMVGITGDFSAATVDDISGIRICTEGIPNAQALAIFIPAAFYLMSFRFN